MRDRIAKLLRAARAVEDEAAGNLELEGIAADVCELAEQMAEIIGVKGVDDDEE